MQKDTITEARLDNLQRVVDWITSHPDRTAAEIGLALGFKRTTLNGYTLALCEMGYLTKTSPSRAGVIGTLPSTYRAVPGTLLVAASSRIPAAKRVAPDAPVPNAPTQRMDLVAALFGPSALVTP